MDSKLPGATGKGPQNDSRHQSPTMADLSLETGNSSSASTTTAPNVPPATVAAVQPATTVADPPPAVTVADSKAKHSSWEEQFEELKTYQDRFGHCLVPISECPQLGAWVKEQRNNIIRHKKGMPSPLTPDRIQALDALLFVWDEEEAKWLSRHKEEQDEWWKNLKDYKEYQKTCSVATIVERNPGLGRWARCQRHEYDALQRKLLAMKSIMEGGVDDIPDDFPPPDLKPSSSAAALDHLISGPPIPSEPSFLKHKRPDDGDEARAGRKIRCTERQEVNASRMLCQGSASTADGDGVQARSVEIHHGPLPMNAPRATEETHQIARFDDLVPQVQRDSGGPNRRQAQHESNFRALVLGGDWDAIMALLRDDAAALRMSAAISFNPVHQVADHPNVPLGVIQRMMECGGDEVLLVDNNVLGENSFHSILCRDVTSAHRNRILQLILNARPDFVALTNQNGLSTLDVFAGAWEQITIEPDRSDDVLEDVEVGRISGDLRQALATRPLSPHDLSRNLRVAWERYELLLRTERRRQRPEGENETGEESIFMCAVSSHFPVPTSALQLAMALSPQAESELDEEGRVALAVAAKNAPLWSARILQQTESCRLLRNRSISLIVDAFPETGTVMDHEGRLPLHVGIEHGLCWTEGLDLIVRDFPEALFRPDPRNDLYPFMYVAASSHERRRIGNTSAGDREVTETIYPLLRQTPSLLDPRQRPY